MIKVLLAVILGGLIGAGVQELGGFFFGAAFGYVLVELVRLRKKVFTLESQVRVFQVKTLGVSDATVEREGPEPEMTFEVVEPELGPAGSQGEDAFARPFETPAPPGGAEGGMQDGNASSVLQSQPELSSASARIPEPTIWSSFPRALQDWITGGNLLVRVGVLVLFVGVAFLVRYAAERQILPLELRLAGVALGAVALLIVGWRLRERRRTYALVLQGGGVALLYLTVFASMRLYSLIPPSLGFPLLIGLAVLSGTLAVLQDARVLASFGTAGGFSAPILASTGQGSHVLLFSYYAVLNLGIVGVAWFKAWRELNLIGFLFTFTIGTLWGVLSYRSYHFSTTEPFLVLFFVFYAAVAILFALRQPPNLRGIVDGPLVFGLPIIAFALQHTLVKPYPYGLAWSAFALAAFYLCLAWMLFIRAPSTLRLMAEAFLAIGAAFGTLAIPLAVDNRWTAAAWAMEGAALVWVGVRQGRLLARISGMLLQVAAGIAFLWSLPGTYGAWPIVNGFWLGSAVVSLSGLFTSWCLHRHHENVRRLESIAGILLGVWGLLWWYGAGFREIDTHALHDHQLGWVVLFLSATSVLCDWLRVRLRWSFLGYPAWGLLPALTLVALNLFGQRGHPSQQGGWWGWPLGMLCCVGILRRQEKGSAFPGWEPFLHPPYFWLWAWLLTWEVSYRLGIRSGLGETWSMAVWGLGPALLLLLVSSQGNRIPWPFARHRAAYLTWGNTGLSVFLMLWMISTFFLEGDPSPLPFLPLLNPLDLATVLSLLAVSQWIHQLKVEVPPIADRLAAVPWVWSYPAVGGSMVFLWLNVMLARTLHFWAGITFSGHGLMQSILFQASLSILWTVTALCIMVFATGRKLRTLWMVGAGLLGVTVVKLFLVDLAESGTLGRVVSFITVGILILVVGYFSPVPPRGEEKVSR